MNINNLNNLNNVHCNSFIKNNNNINDDSQMSRDDDQDDDKLNLNRIEDDLSPSQLEKEYMQKSNNQKSQFKLYDIDNNKHKFNLDDNNVNNNLNN